MLTKGFKNPKHAYVMMQRQGSVRGSEPNTVVYWMLCPF